MRKLSLLLLIMFIASINMQAQTNEGFNYKAQITDNGSALASQNVDVRFTILENGTTIVYEGEQNTTTDDNGIIILNVGEGTVILGDFLTINWANEQFLKVEINTGSGYVDYGTTAMKYVPKAKYADKAGNVFSGNYNDLLNVPNLSTVATSGNYNDLINKPDFTGWDTDASDDFDGNFANLTNVPAGLSDGDDDTHLTEAEVDNYVSNNGYLTSEVDGSTTNELQNLSLNGKTLNITNGTGVSFAGWDADTTDDVKEINDLSDAKTTYYGIFVGYNSGTNANVGGDLVGIGHDVLQYSSSADYSVAVGSYALYSLENGQYNTAIGNQAGYSLQTGSGNIFIGNNAGYNETGSNKLYIENSDSNTPLIGGDFSTDEVTINGSLSIKDGTQGANKILVSDANGKGSWSSSIPQQDKVMLLSPINFQLSHNSSVGYLKSSEYFYFDSGVSASANMAINLPEGAYLDHITIYYYDNSSNNLVFWLMKTDLTQTGSSILGSYTTQVNSSSLNFVSLNANEYISANNTYILSIFDANGSDWDGYNTRIKGVKVYYKE